MKVLVVQRLSYSQLHLTQFRTLNPRLRQRKLQEMGVRKAMRVAWNFIFDKLIYVPLHIIYYVKILTYFAVRWQGWMAAIDKVTFAQPRPKGSPSPPSICLPF